MKLFKANFIFIVAILSAGFTIVSKANFGTRIITGCFQILTVTDGASDDIITQIGGLRPGCDNAKVRINAKPYLKSASAPLNSEQECPPADSYFCCVTVIEVASAPSGVPVLDLGEGLHFYKVSAVICKETQSVPAE